jgi:transcriptional regulator with XRE-family HTH domain
MKERSLSRYSIGVSDIVRRRIRELRAQYQLTQESLCDHAGISIDAISRIESGSRVPTLDTLERIAAAFGLRVVDLIGVGEPPPPAHPPSIQKIIKLLESQPPTVHKAVEKIIKTLAQALSEPEVVEDSLAAEEKAKWGTRRKSHE